MNALLEPILTALGTVITVGLTWLITVAIKWLKSKIENDNIKQALDIAESIAIKSTNAITQTFVDQLKHDGKFDKEAQLEAFKLTKEEIMSRITPDIKEIIEITQGDFEDWIRITVENIIAGKNKK